MTTGDVGAQRTNFGQLVAGKVGLYTSRDEAQDDLLRRLQDQGIVAREIAQLFGEVRLVWQLLVARGWIAAGETGIEGSIVATEPRSTG